MIYLVDLPFSSIYRPPIGLAMVRAALLRAGFLTTIDYANCEFAQTIGPTLYQLIAEKLPHDLLLGDYVFRADDQGTSSLAGYSPYADGGAGRFGDVPDWLFDVLPEVRSQAKQFVSTLAQHVVDSHPALVGLTATFQLAPSLALAGAIKALDPNIPIALGGGHCDGEMGLAIHQQFPQIDYVCRGEGEEVVVALADAMTTHGRVDEITGLVFRRHGESVAVGSRAANITPLDRLPLPDYTDWVERVSRPPLAFERSDLSIPLETSRGCWYGQRAHCTFCGLNGASLVYRSKTPDRVLREITELSSFGVPNIDAIDLILDHDYFNNVLPELARRGGSVSLFYEVKSNLTRAQVALLARAGVRAVQPGIESLSSAVLRLMRKGVAGFQNIRLLKWCMEHAITTEWNILYGFPFEDPFEYQRMADLVPALVHLRPPTIGCNRVLLNRFSPLFFDANRLGVRNIRPVPAYEMAYGLNADRTSTFAYYFDFDFEDGRDPERYIGDLKEQVHLWQELVGTAALCSASVGGDIHIFDTRPCAIASRHVLSGDAVAVYKALDEGTSPERIGAASGIEDLTARALAAQLLHDKLAIDVDGKVLALPVAVDQWIPDGLPKALLESAALLAYRRLATSVWQLSNSHALVPDHIPLPQ